MILVTGGTGFIGRSLLGRLTEAGFRVCTPAKPARCSPHLPPGVPVEVVLAWNSVRNTAMPSLPLNWPWTRL